MPGSTEDERESIILQNKWKVLQRIGGGSFGDIYLSRDLTRKFLNNAEANIFVVKREIDGGTKGKKNHLKHEYHCLAHLNKCDGIPNVYHYEEQATLNYMVMDLEGPNLNDLHNICDKHFGTRTIVHIVLQILPVFKHMHGKGIIHRDLKPDNIVVGRWPHKCRKILLLDFGLSKQFIVREGGKKKHIGLKNPSRIPRSGLTGTVRYASINAHYGDQSRRDDLLSFGHVILFLLRGANLPWMGIKGKTKEQKYAKILKKKESTNARELCASYAREVRAFMDYLSSLTFTARPDYDHLIQLFNCLMKRKNYDPNSKLDWEDAGILKQEWPPVNAVKRKKKRTYKR